MECFIGSEKARPAGDWVSALCSASFCACPPGMVIVPIPGGDGGAYCIDSTEVTYADYLKFWQNNPDAGSQPAACSWNISYTPPANWPFQPDRASAPVTDVDWCDALSYCKFVGKHLCGNIDGGPNDPSGYTDISKSQWYNACTAQGTNPYPYGNMYLSGFCAGADSMLPPQSVSCGMTGCLGTYPESASEIKNCLGGAPGLYHMSGNVAEWEDSCDGSLSEDDSCLVRGGSHCEGGSALACAANVAHPRKYTGCDVGFRCCL